MAILGGQPISAVPISGLDGAGTPPNTDYIPAGISDGNDNLVVHAHDESGHTAYVNDTSDSFAVNNPNVVPAVDIIYNDPFDLPDDVFTDWSDWSWAQAPPPDNCSTPVWVQSTTFGSGTGATSHNITWPSGLLEGDRLLLSMSAFNLINPISESLPAGWVQVYRSASANSVSAGYSYIAAGTESGTFTITFANTGGIAVVINHFRGTDGVAFSASTEVTGSSVNPDPGAVAPAWGAADPSIIVAVEHNWVSVGAGASVSTYPTGYSNGTSITGAGSTSGIGTGTAILPISTASENPSAYTISVSRSWGAWSVAVHGQCPDAIHPETLGLDGQDFTDTADYGYVTDPVGADAAAPAEDFVLGVSEPEYDNTDFADYGSQTDQPINDNNPDLAPSALDDQDFTDTADYGSQTDVAIGDNDQEFLPASVSVDETDTADTADYGSQTDPLSGDAAAPAEDFLLGISEAEYDHTDFAEYGSQQDALQDAACVFPSVVDVTSSVKTSPSTTSTVTLPSGITSGQRLLAYFASNNHGGATWPAGWTELTDDLGLGGPSDPSSSAAYRDCDGTEAASISVTIVNSKKSSHFVIRYATGTFDPLFAPEFGTAATGTSANPDPPSVTPSWAQEKTQWLAFYNSSAATSATISSYPSGYADNQTYADSGGGGGNDVAAGMATKDVSATSEDPGAYTISASNPWIAQTFAVRGLCQDFVLGVSEHEHDWTDHTEYGSQTDPLSSDNNPEVAIAAVALDDQDFTDLSDYGTQTDPLSDNVTVEDFLLGVGTGQDDQDFTDFTDYGSQTNPYPDDNNPEIAVAAIALDDQDFTDRADYGSQTDPLSADAVFEISPSALDDQDFTDLSDYGSQTDQPIDDNNPDLAPSSLDDQDFTDTGDYGSQADPLSDNSPNEDFTLGDGEGLDDQDWTDLSDYSYYNEPNSNYADVSVLVTGGNIVVGIGCFEVISWIDIPDVSSIWTGVPEPTMTWNPIAEASNSWSDITEPTNPWVDISDPANTWTEEC